MRQSRCLMQGHAGQFSMDSNGDKLASYSILALNHSAAAFNTAWTLRTQFIGNCSEDHHCPLETTFTPSVQIVWPGSCEDRIYKSVAVKRFGEWLSQDGGFLALTGALYVTMRQCQSGIFGLPLMQPFKLMQC